MNVYKYRYGSKRDLESLQKDYFYAPHPSELNDPFENLFETGAVNQLLTILDDISSVSTNGIRQTSHGIFEHIQNKVGIYSLSKTVLHELLWAYYADSYGGFCIEYDLEKLKRLTKPAGSFNVVYPNNVPEITFDKIEGNTDEKVVEILKLTSGTKSKAWLHEDEIRIVMDQFGKVEYDFRAVKAIYFGLRMPRTQQDLDKDKLPCRLSKVSQEQVMEALKGRGIRYYQMVLKPNSYLFEYVEIEDLYKDVPKYKEIFNIVDKSCINYCNYGWDVEPLYFDKTAAIVAEDPYCHELYAIFLDQNESSKKQQPILGISFSLEEGKYRKTTFTLQQIDEEYKQLKSPLT